MGNELGKCKCACHKDEQNTANFENLDNNNNQSAENNPANIPFIINSSLGQSNLKEYVNGRTHNQIEDKLKGGNNIFSNSFSQFGNSTGSKFLEKSPEIIKIIKIQSDYRGYNLRKKYNSYLKQNLIDETNQLIKDLTEQYTKFNLKRAESLIGTKFDKNGWKNFYIDNNNENQEEINNLFTYDYGKTYKCKLLIIQGLIPSFYIGEININYEMQGYGVLLKNDGSKYEGFWRKNYFTGWGRLIDIDGTLYEGYFKNGNLNGKGIKKTLTGSIYIGDFVDNKKEGKGKEETNEHIYEGEFKNDKKNGNGKLTYKILNDTYEGEFKDNCITGIGFYTWANKDTYKGSFVNGKMHGKGLYKWPDGGEYYGDYVNNIKEGNGRFKWVNGKIFEGQFKKGRPDGLGKLITGNKELNVEFKDGKLVTNIKEMIKKDKEKESEIKNNEDDDIK